MKKTFDKILIGGLLIGSFLGEGRDLHANTKISKTQEMTHSAIVQKVLCSLDLKKLKENPKLINEIIAQYPELTFSEKFLQKDLLPIVIIGSQYHQQVVSAVLMKYPGLKPFVNQNGYNANISDVFRKIQVKKLMEKKLPEPPPQNVTLELSVKK